MRKMNIKEVSAEGLSRELQITVPAADLVAKLDARIDEIKGNCIEKGSAPARCLPRIFVKPMATSLWARLFRKP